MIEDIEKYIDSRIQKLMDELKFLGRGSERFINNKSIIIELKKVKEYIKRRKER
jgi:hypothetical protein